MESTEFSEWFRQQLASRGWTQRGFAQRARLAPSTVNEWYRGTRTPDPASVDIIADVLGLTVDHVLTIAGHRPDLDPIPADSPRAQLIDKLRRVRLTDDRINTLEAIIDRWLRFDREARDRIEEQGIRNETGSNKS